MVVVRDAAARTGWVVERWCGRGFVYNKLGTQWTFFGVAAGAERGTKRGAPVTTPVSAVASDWGTAKLSATPQPHHEGRRSAQHGIPSFSPLNYTMALARPLPPLWQTLLPTLNGSVRPVINFPLLQRLSQPFRSLPTPFAALALPSLSLPSFPSLSDIWEGVLKAVPKKKTSHRKKRQRFMAGKGLKDLTNLNRCSACGRVKRAHLLCPYCVHSE